MTTAAEPVGPRAGPGSASAARLAPGAPRPGGRSRRSPTSGTSRRAGTPTPTTRRPRRPRPRARPRCSSGRSTRPASSRSTSPRSRCGSWASRSGCWASAPSPSSCPRPSRASRRCVLLHDAVRRQLGREAALIAGIAFARHPGRGRSCSATTTPTRCWCCCWSRRLGAGPRPRGRPAALAARRGGARGLRVPHQVPPGVPRAARASSLTWLVAAPGQRSGAAWASLAASGVAVRRGVGLVGGRRGPDPGRLAPVHRRLDRQHRAGPRARLRRPGPDLRRRGPAVRAGGGPAGGGFGGSPGLLRMLNAAVGRPDRLAAAGRRRRAWSPGSLARLRAPRTDPRRAAFLLWGAWAVVHVLVFSLMSGIAHPYYSVAIAPAAAALVGGGVVELWRLAVAGAVGGAGRSAALIAGSGLVVLAAPGADARVLARRGPGGVLRRRSPPRILVVAASVADDARRRARRPRRDRGGPRGRCSPVPCCTRRRPPAPRSRAATRRPARPHGRRPAAVAVPGGASRPAGSRAMRPGTDAALVAWLLDHRGGATWLVAVSSANQAGPLQLASGVPGHGDGRLHGRRPGADAGRAPGRTCATGGCGTCCIGGSGGRPGRVLRRRRPGRRRDGDAPGG